MELIVIFKKLLPGTVKSRLRPHLPSWLKARVEDARAFVGTDETSGRFQFEPLQREGCRPTSKVLEIGCGNLHAGVLLIQFLEKGHYVGLDPNEWLRRSRMRDQSVRRLVRDKKARFLSTHDFDASSLQMKFDFVLSHSVLSHCAHWQLEQYLQNTAKVLAPGGRIVASIRLADGNTFGSTGSPDKRDSMDKTWQYPDASWFELATVTRVASQCSLTVTHRPEYTELFMTRPQMGEVHDWLVFVRKGT